MRMPLAHQAATEVLFKIFVPSICELSALAPASEYVAIPSSPAPRTKQFCTVRLKPTLSGLGVLPLLRFIPSAQLSATRLSRITPLLPLSHLASQCCTHTRSISQPSAPLALIPESSPPAPPTPL